MTTEDEEAMEKTTDTKISKKRPQTNLNDMKEYVRLFLLAWHESITHQQRLVPQLAETLGCGVAEIFYRIKMLPFQTTIPAQYRSIRMIQGTKWGIYFHGIRHCDLRHHDDGRFIQINFGPYGRYDVFSGWSTLLFVMASKAPWSAFPTLKHYLATTPPPYTYLSGDHEKMTVLTETLLTLGVFEVADRELYDVKQRSMRIDEHGCHILSVPPPYNDPLTERFWDFEVCDAWVLSERGQALMAQGCDTEAFSHVWEVSIMKERTTSDV
jgi:hypothetical protein